MPSIHFLFLFVFFSVWFQKIHQLQLTAGDNFVTFKQSIVPMNLLWINCLNVAEFDITDMYKHDRHKCWTLSLIAWFLTKTITGSTFFRKINLDYFYLEHYGFSSSSFPSLPIVLKPFAGAEHRSTPGQREVGSGPRQNTGAGVRWRRHHTGASVADHPSPGGMRRASMR